MSVFVTPFLRNALRADAVVSGAAGLLMIAGAPLLSPLLGLSERLLFWAGIALVPFVAMLLLVARRATVSKLVVIDLIAINALWAAASFGLLVSGAVGPNLLGIAFVVGQALTVVVFAELQFIGLRRAGAGGAA
ncbi:hypothetical protein [Aminobacter sp. HY435]|uniref:hypothetical protein n=1 Tax=Aminobacter sp. HY435 TaxID=2970917 RepID=UPI0022B9A971|nr:hypothetical protein [Aminobacter sp. HY435]